MKLATLILELLKRLLDFITNKRISRESQKAKDDPAKWYNDHFNDGVQPPTDKQPSADKTGDKGDPKQ